ncbi:hypothetical protein LINPERPRIM_LOCUS6434, partial [Linum perenne]
SRLSKINNASGYSKTRQQAIASKTESECQ